MAGVRPTFITGANAKVKVNNKTLAFCTDLSYSVQVITQTPKVLGMYEGSSVEPLGYNVSGSFTVIRYAKDVKDNIGSGKSPHGLAENDAGNGVGNWGQAWGGGAGGFLARSGVGNDGRANEALDPSKMQNGVGFDIQVYQKTPGGDIGVANIRNARISQADFSITKKGAAVQRFTFVALYVDEDSFVADFSGLGQQFNGG
jgi:hypothetical protein